MKKKKKVKVKGGVNYISKFNKQVFSKTKDNLMIFNFSFILKISSIIHKLKKKTGAGAGAFFCSSCFRLM